VVTGWRLAGIAPGSTSDSCETGFGGAGKHSIVGVPQLPNLLPGAVPGCAGVFWAEDGRKRRGPASTSKQQRFTTPTGTPAALLIAAKPGLAGHKSGTAGGYAAIKCAETARGRAANPQKTLSPGIRARQTRPNPQHVPYLFHHGG